MKFRNWLLAPLLALALGAGIFAPQQAKAAALSDYAENCLIDSMLRGQPCTMPTTVYFALATAAGSDAACGTEVSTANWTTYARVAVTTSLANFAGTQSAGSTAASSGTSGTTSNNAPVTFPAPQASGGTAVSVVEWCVMSAASGGNLWFRAPLTANKTVNNGDAAPSFAAGAATFQIDN